MISDNLFNDNLNSNIESFNSTFKRVYTNYFKCSMYVACLKIFDCIGDYSNQADERNRFNESPAYDENVRKYADHIGKNCFKKTGLYSKKIIYQGAENTYTIRLDDDRCFKSWSCNCSQFIKWAICSHVVAYSNSLGLDLYGPKYRQPINFVKKIKKGAPVKTGRYSSFKTLNTLKSHIKKS